MIEQFEDQQLVCADCGKEFTFTAEDQEFYSTKGYLPPKRCPECRAARKSQSKSGHNRTDYGQKQQYEVTCSNCGCKTTVPFEPKGDRPVYCSECYKNLRIKAAVNG